ncbi:MAG: cell division protein SepF [Acidimicrobiales bacterium]
MGVIKKAMVYLGLDDEEYQDYPPEQQPDETESASHRPPARHPGSSGSTPAAADAPSGIGTVRPINPRTDGGESAPSPGGASPMNQTGPNPSRPRPQVVRPIAMTPNAKPHVVTPDSFNEAQEVADKYKGSQPVIMNLRAVDKDLSRRLIDFASGLCYGLGGQMERVASQVYLLTPTNVEVSPEERRRLHDRGYDS